MTEEHAAKNLQSLKSWEACVADGLLKRFPSARLLFVGEQIERRLSEICCRIVSEHIGRGASEGRTIALVPIMEGAAMVASKAKALMQAVCPSLTVEEYPIRIARTKDEKLVAPRLEAFGHEGASFEGWTVIVVDDLTDTGETLQLARRMVRRSAPARLTTVALVQKRKSSVGVCSPDYTCFCLDYENEQAEKRWLFGYGMDVRGEFRNCDFIAEFARDPHSNAERHSATT